MPADRLAEHAQARHRRTLQRARDALTELAAAGTPVTVAGLAAHAGISRSWLYTQPDLLEQVRQLQQRSPDTSPAQASTRASDQSLRQRLALHGGSPKLRTAPVSSVPQVPDRMVSFRSRSRLLQGCRRCLTPPHGASPVRSRIREGSHRAARPESVGVAGEPRAGSVARVSFTTAASGRVARPPAPGYASERLVRIGCAPE
ncbi:hypothetical protein ABIA39_003399 [Nocardia sp. GAS34]|uniref:DUF6262 family protein n=1 Tax=unclassified Nocardia TaxID=2637762 RepID=UPI003D1E586D